MPAMHMAGIKPALRGGPPIRHRTCDPEYLGDALGDKQARSRCSPALRHLAAPALDLQRLLDQLRGSARALIGRDEKRQPGELGKRLVQRHQCVTARYGKGGKVGVHHNLRSRAERTA